MPSNIEIKLTTNKSEWEKGLELFSYTTMFLAWEWREFELARKNNFENYCIYKDNKLVGLLPVKTINAKRGKYLHVRHGPVINWEDQNVVTAVLDFLKKLVQKRNVHFIRISPLINKNYLESIARLGFKDATSHANDDELTVVIDLEKSEEEILKGMRKNTRNLIRRAEKEGITIKNGANEELFNEFAQVYKDTVARKHWTAYSIEYIKKEFELFSKENKAQIFVAYYRNEPIAASIFITHRMQVIYHYSGSVGKFKNLPSAYLLHWEAIKFFKAQGIKLYNFWGVCKENQKNHPWYGLSLFKRGFSNNELEFLHAQDLVVHPLAHITRLYEWVEAWWRGYK